MTDASGQPAPGSLPDEAAAVRDAATARPGGVPTDADGDSGLDGSGVGDWIEEGGPVAEDDTATAGGDEVTLLKTELAERTLDLQRLQAEYVNYKRRVERDRDLVKQNATYTVLAPVTEVLDTIDRAREHGEVDGGFQTVAEQLERIVSTLGLAKFGAVGDAFDPTLHEALSSLGEDGDVTVTTVKVVAKAGYTIGDRVVRAAQVLTVEPA